MGQHSFDELSPDERQLLQSLLERAWKDKVGVYLVGGAVRDLLMGLPAGTKDLDFTIEGDPYGVADGLARAFKGTVVRHERFLTAKVTIPWVGGEGRVIDLAGTRREEYPRPGALPVVSPASLADDLRRRDFSLTTLPAQSGRFLDRREGLCLLPLPSFTATCPAAV